MKVEINFELGNAAMQSGMDIAIALRDLANKVEEITPEVGDLFGIRDMNGNKVGAYKVLADVAEPMHLLYQFNSGESPNDGSGRRHTVVIYRLHPGKGLERVITRSDKFVSEWQLAREAIKAANIMPAEAFRANGDLMNALELKEAGIAIVESI